jgi:hypothetical protein
MAPAYSSLHQISASEELPMETNRLERWLTNLTSNLRIAWKEYLGPWVAGVSLSSAVIFFVYQFLPFLTDPVLFWLKLTSFFVTAILGVLGVVTDFKDENRKLTRLGKLNLGGLVLAIVVGVLTQRLEYENAARSSAEAKRKDETLLNRLGAVLEENNQILGAANQNLRTTSKTLHEVNRNLEPIGDSIGARYQLSIPLKDPEGIDSFRRQIAERASGLPGGQVYENGNTRIERQFDRTDTLVLKTTFNKTSALASYAPPAWTSMPFEISFHKNRPKNNNCNGWISSDALYQLDELPPAVQLVYNTTYSYITHSTIEKEVRLAQVYNRSMLSVLDFSRVYMRITKRSKLKFDIFVFTVILGKRSFTLTGQDLKAECNGYTFQLPEIQPN